MCQDKIVWENIPPFYRKPSKERLEVAVTKLHEVEEHIAPGYAVMFGYLVRVLIKRGVTVAEAMWAIYRQISDGRYIAS